MRRIDMAQVFYVAFPWNQAVQKKKYTEYPTGNACPQLKDSTAFFTFSYLQHKAVLYCRTSASFLNSNGSGWPSPSRAFVILPFAGDIMQEGPDNCMHVYIHLHSKSFPICAFVRTSVFLFSTNVTNFPFPFFCYWAESNYFSRAKKLALFIQTTN